jgi:hypothetical protein
MMVTGVVLMAVDGEGECRDGNAGDGKAKPARGLRT